MADLVKIKGGSGTTPQLQEREIAYNKTEKALYIGTKDGNVRLCGEVDALKIVELEEKIAKLEAITGTTSSE